MARKYKHWVVQRSISEGGQAHIFLVADGRSATKELFALKRFKKQERLHRFETELKAIERVSHDGIVSVVDYDIDGDQPYYVMPYYHRGNARNARAHAWSWPKRFAFFEKILEAVAAAHAAGIVHRDLKPENILVADDGQPVVSDFGICFVDNGRRMTLTTEVVGPRFYLAPEVEFGRQDSVSARADVYSLGKVLYWLAAGRDLVREYHWDEHFDLAVICEDARCTVITDYLDRTVCEDSSLRLRDAGRMLKHFRRARARFQTFARRERRRARIDRVFVRPVRRLVRASFVVILIVGAVMVYRAISPVLKGFEDLNFDMMDVVSSIEFLHADEPAAPQVGDIYLDQESNLCFGYVPLQRDTPIPGLWVTIHEVLQDQWVQLMANNPSSSIGGGLPVENVSFGDALLFCERLSDIGRRKYRLPTEDEWNAMCSFDPENSVPIVKLVESYKTQMTLLSESAKRRFMDQMPDGQTRSLHLILSDVNAVGLFEMRGNVAEWCLPGSSEQAADLAIARGGSWRDGASPTCALRQLCPVDQGFDHIGFRVVHVPKKLNGGGPSPG